ncbi:sulfite exporter TauE/SafE family protein [Pseudactinotalea suaedae]|uniref:sulfite exporter TauE/SafE family protein n=1 Tax=Pseudactinotalea suaedae TaxID=1524924 RepID=UPI0012E199C6|nr:sulfite exporter TauE/SafE family protein [Pseudactinotalea suaedae]
MERVIIFALVGLAAQLVDGSLGMAYGVTSSTLLLAAGIAPAAASASVHLAEIGTTAVSGFSHWRFGNVDWGVVVRIALPGAIGAFLGATVLTNLSTESATPWMALILLALGIYIISRFVFRRQPTVTLGVRPRTAFLAPLGLFAGFVDATGGGGWGPVATPSLLSTGRLDPRRVIGSVSAAEFAVTVAASLGFITALGTQGVQPSIVLALLVGGVIAAPFAAYLVRRLSLPMLGALVGGVILVTNTRTIIRAFEVEQVWIYVVLAAIWATLLAIAVRKNNELKAEKAAEETSEPAPVAS